MGVQISRDTAFAADQIRAGVYPRSIIESGLATRREVVEAQELVKKRVKVRRWGATFVIEE